MESAVAAQLELGDETWPETVAAPEVRMGIHTGAAQLYGESDYLGPTLNRVARLADVAHGGQIVASEVTHGLSQDGPAAIGFRDMGLHQLRGFGEPDRIFQVLEPGLRSEFPPLRSALGVTAGNLDAVRPEVIGRQETLVSLGAPCCPIRL